MICVEISNGFLDFSPVDFSCPKCDKHYSEEKYVDRCEKNKSGHTRIKCECGYTFYATYDYMGDWHTWIKAKTK